MYDKTFAAGSNNASGRPTLTAIAGVPTARANCMALVSPDAYGNAPKDAAGDYTRVNVGELMALLRRHAK